jgi:alpha-L-fucosidase
MPMSIAESIKTFQDARLGLFIHFGVYSIPGGEWNGQTIAGEQGEWIMNYLQIPIAEYEKIALQFNPVNFNADKIVTMARKAGMSYIVITAKHHDGFALFHSACDPYNCYDWAGFKRDIVGELAQACKRQGMKLGLYYSQALDWHEQHAGGWHVKPWGMDHTWGNIWDYPDNAQKHFEIYFEKKVKPQVTELLTNYGELLLMWFDTPLTISAQQSDELYRLVKSLQPNCLVNSRIGNGKGDYGSLGDNEIPTIPLARPFECPMTLNDTWGYNRLDDNWKPGREIIGMLAKLASRNVNFLINIGPMGDGTIPQPSVDILHELSEWMGLYGQAVHGTTGSPFPGDFDWGFVTVHGKTLYAFIEEDGEQCIELNGLITPVKRVAALADGRSVLFEQNNNGAEGVYRLSARIPQMHSFLPVFAIECECEPETDGVVCQQGGSLALYPVKSTLFDGETKTAASVLMMNEFTDYHSFGKMKIKCGGILSGWREDGHWLQWEARFLEAGEYAVEIVTSAEGFSEEARNDSFVTVALTDGIHLNASLKKAHTFSDSRYNKNGTDNTRVVSSCGSILIHESGLKTIRLTLACDVPNSERIPLIALRFILQIAKP